MVESKPHRCPEDLTPPPPGVPGQGLDLPFAIGEALHPDARERELLDTLRGWEAVQAVEQEAEVIAPLLDTLVQAGHLDQARTWWQWAVRHLAGLLALDVQVRLEAGLVRTALWLGLPDRSVSLRRALAGAASGPARLDGAATLAEHALAHGNLAAAERGGRAWWEALDSRAALVWGADLYVRVMRAAGQLAEAQAAGRAAVHLSAGLPAEYQVRAQLASLMAHLEEAPGLVAEELATLGQWAEPAAGSPLHAQLRVYKALALQARGQDTEARGALSEVTVGPHLAPLLGLRAAEAHWWAAQHPERPSQPPGRAAHVELTFLGPPELRVRGCRVRLRSRFADLLVALALRPDGLTGEELTLLVYGERGTANCCKTELSRLRHLIPVETRPYRLAASLHADFVAFPRLLARGLSAEALELYRGPLLRASDAPVVREQREYLQELLRQAVLATADTDLAWQAAAHFPEDREVWGALEGNLSPPDPRRGAVVARLEGLRRADV